MSTDSAQLFFSLLTFVAAAGAVALVGLRLAAGLGSDGAARIGREISDASTWLAFLVAATATLGSLYFSEVANFVPCRLCWFQRIAMYPLSVILLVGAVRRDAGVRWYVGPLAAIGAVVAALSHAARVAPRTRHRRVRSCSVRRAPTSGSRSSGS